MNLSSLGSRDTAGTASGSTTSAPASRDTIVHDPRATRLKLPHEPWSRMTSRTSATIGWGDDQAILSGVLKDQSAAISVAVDEARTKTTVSKTALITLGANFRDRRVDLGVDLLFG